MLANNTPPKRSMCAHSSGSGSRTMVPMILVVPIRYFRSINGLYKSFSLYFLLVHDYLVNICADGHSPVIKGQVLALLQTLQTSVGFMNNGLILLRCDDAFLNRLAYHRLCPSALVIVSLDFLIGHFLPP